MTTITYPVEAVVGNSGFPEPGIGFEPAARAVRIILSERLNDEIDVQAARWHAADTAANQMGFDPGVPAQLEIPHIVAENFHEGPHRSLVEAPPEFFPNVSVMAYQTVPSSSQAFDQTDSSDITLFIEAMAIAGPVPDGLEVAFETIVHRRIQRMTEAVVIVIGRDPSLLGTAHNLRTPPRGGIGNSTWVKRTNQGAGEKHLWQGSRLQYTLQRHHAF